MQHRDEEFDESLHLSIEQREAVSRAQAREHGEGHDYTVGSPHLRHVALRERLDSKIRTAIADVLDRQESCDVLEIGAGHGSFTETILAAGGTPTVTEMSEASFNYLQQKFRDVPGVRVMYDSDGSAPLRDGARYDVILLISVIHHIPDYIEAVSSLCDKLLRPGGTLLTFQDPLWYPRQTRWARTLSAGSYLAWRVTQGEIKRGLRTSWRRFKGSYDDSEPSDLVEYHVVRSGVDDCALYDLLRARFADVEVDRYFSTQAPLLQAVGAKYFPDNTFGIVARARRDSIPPQE
jgi:2-polyprenyl-3-methyl-5-hydroxy-6-metoxy-1,4-benzoquinol methylase